VFSPVIKRDYVLLRMLNKIKEENILSRMEKPGSAHQLALFRIILGLEIGYVTWSNIFRFTAYVAVPGGTQNIFPEFLNQWIDAIAVPYLIVITQVLCIFLVLGLLTRVILPLLFTSFFFLFSWYYVSHNAPIPWLYIWFPLLLLNFTKCSDVLSLDRIIKLQRPLPDLRAKDYRWPMEVVAGWLSYIYVAAGLSKLLPIYKGWYWLQGGTSQEIMYNRYLDSMYFYLFEKPLFDYTEYHWVFAILAIASVMVELACIIILFTHRYNAAIFAMLLGMHLFLYLAGVMGFLQLMLVLSVSLVQPAFFNRLFKEQS